MKIIILFFSFIFLFLCPQSDIQASSPMVERHIFSPETDDKVAFKSPLAFKLERELLFTGVIIAPSGKWAMIHDRKSKNEAGTTSKHKEGDEISGMVIKEIGKNFLILVGDDKEVRLNLYQEVKERSPELAESKSPFTTDKHRSTQNPSSTQGRTTVAPNIQAEGKASQSTDLSPSGYGKTSRKNTSSKNPFRDAILKEKEKGTLFQSVDDRSIEAETSNPFEGENIPARPFMHKTTPDLEEE